MTQPARIRTRRIPSRRRLTLALMVAMTAPGVAYAQACGTCLPDTGTVKIGDVTSNSGRDQTDANGNRVLNPGGAFTGQNSLIITQNSHGAIIDWGSFNIANGYSVSFRNGAATTPDIVTLNRVVGFATTGPTPSTIDGILNSTGSVFLINGAGITFAANARVNVGSLIASTMQLSDTDFLSGVASNRYSFTPQGIADVTPAAFYARNVDVEPGAQLNAGAFGTIALLGGGVNNGGTITADRGTVAFASSPAVTLDFFGDGLTNVTIAPLGMASSPGGAPGGLTNGGTIQADGGNVVMRTNTLYGVPGDWQTVGGLIVNGGMIAANSVGTRNGRITLDAGAGTVSIGLHDSKGQPWAAGRLSAVGNDAGETGGTVELHGQSVQVLHGVDPLVVAAPPPVASVVDVSGNAGGGSITAVAGESIIVSRYAQLDANATGTGQGGSIQFKIDPVGNGIPVIAIDGALNAMGAKGGTGDGGSIELENATGFNALSATSSLNVRSGTSGGNGGSVFVNGTFTSLDGVVDATGAANGGRIDVISGTGLRNGLILRGQLDASGGVDGGHVSLTGPDVLVSELGTIKADGATGAGGDITLAATDRLLAVGNLSATGAITGGTVLTRANTFDLRGLQVEAGGAAAAGLWTIEAPNIDVVHGAVDWTVGTPTAFGTNVQDAEINAAFSRNTSVTLNAVAPTGSINFSQSVDINASNGVPLALTANAEGSIYGFNFSIRSASAPLDLVFNANASGANTASISLNTVTFTTSGGDVSMHGQSDPLAPVSGSTSGVRLTDATIDTRGGASDGDVVIRGQASVAIEGPAEGVSISGGTMTTGRGNITVQGIATASGTGLILNGASLQATTGTVDLSGTGSDGRGLFATGGGVTTAGGAIVMNGSSTFEGVHLEDVQVASGGGAIDVTGNASEVGGVGVWLDGSRLNGGAGAVTVTGAGPAGDGIRMTTLRTGIMGGVDTTSGAITLKGTGANYGIDLGTDPGVIKTQTGDINLIGNATGATALAGVRLGAGDLTTAGGDILIDGKAAAGTGVLLGDAGAFSIGSGGGAVSITGTGVDTGVNARNGTINGGGGAITIAGTATAAGVPAVLLTGTRVNGGTGSVSVTGTNANGDGIRLLGGSGVTTTSGAITFNGTGASAGINFDSASDALQTQSGDITLTGNAVGATALAGVRIGGGNVTTAGGDVTLNGTTTRGTGVLLGDTTSIFFNTGGGQLSIKGSSADGMGVLIGGGFPVQCTFNCLPTRFGIDTSGGGIAILGNGTQMGVGLANGTATSSGGAITVTGNAAVAGGTGVRLQDAILNGGAGNVTVAGSNPAGTGIGSFGASSVLTTTGAITMSGAGAQSGMSIVNGLVQTDTGRIDLRGRSTASGTAGLDTTGTRVVTNGGGVSLAGEAVAGAGAIIGEVSAGNGLVVIRAGNDGASDALVLTGPISSGIGVNLRPGGVDANGGLTERTGDAIAVGSNGNGFALSQAELARISAPEVVIGSHLHGGAITVAGATTRNGNLTLQNDGGTGGIAVNAALDAGGGTLVLSSGGSITQNASGAITAHSLLARAGSDVLLASASNNVAANTLAGSAGGAFRYQDVDALSIGSVSGRGMDASGNALATLSATGISAGGDVFVRNLAGDLILRSGIAGNTIDLVTAGRLQNLGNATLTARDDWRVWANTWEGETRGGLAGNGDLPNLYGCTFAGNCAVTVPTADNHFVYTQQPLATISFNNATREYGLPNPALGYNVTGGILGDTAANVATGTATTPATQASDVGQYAISGTFTSRAGYRLQLVPGVFAITPATLLFTANPATRYLGTANPPFSGNVSGFRNGDTLSSVFGTNPVWTSPAGQLSPIGFYPINGGTPAKNYVFSQAPGNATALQIIPLPAQFIPTVTGSDGLGGFSGGRDDLIVYSGGDGGPAGPAVRGAPMCALNGPLGDEGLQSSGDTLSREWTKVRARPNLTNCFETERKNSCGDF